MSGLILPSYRPHWRPDWKALLMGLRLTSGHLTYTAGSHLALCPTCVCDTPATAPTSCQCQYTDYGAYKTFGTVTVTISGTHTPTAATSPACAAPASCASVNGTYVLSCGGSTTEEVWRIDQFVCTSGGQDYYYGNSVRIIYAVGSLNQLTVRFGSFKYAQATGAANPYPTLTSIPTQASVGLYSHVWQETTTGKNYWLYQLVGSCTTDCNSSGTVNGCPSASGTLTMTTSGSPLTSDGCDASTLTVSASITAAA